MIKAIISFFIIATITISGYFFMHRTITIDLDSEQKEIKIPVNAEKLELRVGDWSKTFTEEGRLESESFYVKYLHNEPSWLSSAKGLPESFYGVSLKAYSAEDTEKIKFIGYGGKIVLKNSVDFPEDITISILPANEKVREEMKKIYRGAVIQLEGLKFIPDKIYRLGVEYSSYDIRETGPEDLNLLYVTNIKIIDWLNYYHK
ncbi:MAG: hypothetical protein ABH881_03940 [bacterium]